MKRLSVLGSAASVRRLKDKGGTRTRKLIGHSGPVYSVSFDPTNGSAAPPQYLLSSSADASVRLWSLDTMTSLVAYRGHQNPVWDVEWSPMGIYFATASRDRTARLWSSDRITALRVFSGHQSDVDVRPMNLARVQFIHAFSCSASNSTQIHCTSQRDQVIRHADSGMFKKEHAYGFSLVTRVLSRQWRCLETGDYWRVLVSVTPKELPLLVLMICRRGSCD